MLVFDALIQLTFHVVVGKVVVGAGFPEGYTPFAFDLDSVN
jgi:hypothetical protein